MITTTITIITIINLAPSYMYDDDNMVGRRNELAAAENFRASLVQLDRKRKLAL